jgi:mono/diheme cytochrome c family protein
MIATASTTASLAQVEAAAFPNWRLRLYQLSPGRLSSMAPRKTVALAALAAAALLSASALAHAAEASVPGNPTRGKALYLRAGIFCGSCHTLKAARSTGRDGPNLDKSKPSYARIVEAVAKGNTPTRRWPTGMPAYAGRNRAYGQITKGQIQDLAAFIYTATHK